MAITADGEKIIWDSNESRLGDGGSSGMVRHSGTVCAAVDSELRTGRRAGGRGLLGRRRVRGRRFVMGLSPRVALLGRAGHARPARCRGCAELASRCAVWGRLSAT